MDSQVILFSAVAFVGINTSIYVWSKRIDRLNEELKKQATSLKTAHERLQASMAEYRQLKERINTTSLSTSPKVSDLWLANLDAQIERERLWQQCKREAAEKNNPKRRVGDSNTNED